MLQEIPGDLEDLSSRDGSSTSSKEACKRNCLCSTKTIEVITTEDQDDLLVQMTYLIRDLALQSQYMRRVLELK